MGRSKVTKSASISIGIAWGALSSIIITLVVCVTFAKLIETELLPEAALDYGATLALLCASILGAWIAQKKIGQKPLLACVMSAGLYFLILLGINTLFFGGQLGGILETALLVIGGAVVPAILKSVGGASKKTNHKKYRYR